MVCAVGQFCLWFCHVLGGFLLVIALMIVFCLVVNYLVLLLVAGLD